MDFTVINKCSIGSWQQKCLKLYQGQVSDYKIANDDYTLQMTLGLGNEWEAPEPDKNYKMKEICQYSVCQLNSKT